jgi:hypothetical protein
MKVACEHNIVEWQPRSREIYHQSLPAGSSSQLLTQLHLRNTHCTANYPFTHVATPSVTSFWGYGLSPHQYEEMRKQDLEYLATRRAVKKGCNKHKLTIFHCR